MQLKMIGDQLSSSLRQFNQTSIESNKQSGDQLDKSLPYHDQFAPESFQQQRQYFVSQDAQDLQNLCYKREATINSEDNENNQKRKKENNIILDLSNIEERNGQFYENQHHSTKKKSYFKQIETILEKNPLQLQQQYDGDNSDIYNKDYLSKSSLRKANIFSNAQIINDNGLEQCNMTFSQQEIQNEDTKNQKKDYQNFQTNEDRRSQILHKKRISGNMKFQGAQKPKQLIEVIQKFSYKLKQFFSKRTLKGREKQLSQKIRQQILDLSDYFAADCQHSYRSQLFNRRAEIFIYLFRIFRIEKIPVFNPESMVMFLFNLFSATYNGFYLFMVSLNIFFRTDFGYFFEILMKFTNIIWASQIVISLNTAIYYDYKYSQNRKIIIKQYIKQYFIYEIVPYVFLNLQEFYSAKNIVFDLMQLLKFKRVMNTFAQLGFYFVQRQVNQLICKIFFLLCKLLLLAHILACFWSQICYFETNSGTSTNLWSIQQEYLELDWKNKYFSSLYWALSILTSNQIFIPNSNIQMLYTSLSIIVSYIALGYFVSSIINIIKNLENQNKDFQQDLKSLNKFMQRKNIQPGLKGRVINNLREYYLNEQKINYLEERQSILKLKENLREELMISANSQIINKHSFLSTIFSKECLNQIQNQLIEILFMPNQIIYDYSLRNDDQYIYFIIDGNVKLIESQMQQDYEVYDRYDEVSGFEQSYAQVNFDINQPNSYFFKQIQESLLSHKAEDDEKGRIVGQGECFGMFGFFTGYEYMKRAQSVGYTSVLKIGRQAVMKIVKKEKRSFEMFKQVGDQIFFERNLSCIGIKCSNCNSIDHESNQCIYTRFDKLNPYIIYKFNHSTSQDRNSNFIRKVKNKTKTYTLKLNSIVHSNQNQLRMESYHEKILEQTNKSTTSIQEIFQSNNNYNNNNSNSNHYKRNSMTDQFGNMLSSKLQQEDKENTEEEIQKEFQIFRKQSSYSSQSQNQKEEIKDQTLSYYLKNNYDLISPIEFNRNHQLKNQELGQGSSFGGGIDYTEDQSSKLNSIEKKMKKNMATNISSKLILEKSSIYNQLLPKSKSQMQLANEFSQKQKTQSTKDYGGFNSKTVSLLLPLSNILKNVNQINEDQQTIPLQANNLLNDNPFINEMDTLQKFDFYFRQYNSQRVLDKYNEKKIKFTQKKDILNSAKNSSKIPLN